MTNSSKNDEILVYMKKLLDAKLLLSHARLDLERAIKTGKDIRIHKEKISGLQQELKQMYITGEKVYLENETEDNALINPVSSTDNYAISERLQDLLSKYDKQSVQDSNEKLLLQYLHKQINKLKFKESLTSLPVSSTSVRSKYASESLEDITKEINEQKSTSSIRSKRSDVFEKLFNMKSKTDSIIVELDRDKAEDSLIAYNKEAMNNLLTRFASIYKHDDVVSMEPISEKDKTEKGIDSTTSKNKEQISELQLILPPNKKKETSDLPVKKVDVPTKDELDQFDRLIKMESNSNLRKNRVEVFPRSSKLWCDSNSHLPEDPCLVTHMQCLDQKKHKLAKIHKTSQHTKRKREKEATMKRIAVRVRAVAKINIRINYAKAVLSTEKMQRVQDLLGNTGLLSKNVNIALESAKCLGKLKCTHEDVIHALQNIAKDKNITLLTYECSKSLLLLGCWYTPAMEILTYHLKKGAPALLMDIMTTIKKSRNAYFTAKSPQKTDLSNALLHVLLSPQPVQKQLDLPFHAALCLGHLCINSKPAKLLLMQTTKTSTCSNKIVEALVTLIKQMNCTSDDIIRVLLSQLKTAPGWKQRMQAIRLLRVIGLRRIELFGFETVFNVLHELLWNHPNRDFRCQVSEAMTTFGMRGQAYENTLKRLEDKKDSVRAQAVISLCTLGMKGEKELQLLLDNFDFDSCVFVRTQVIKVFKNLRWNHPRVIRALQDKQKADDLLAQEATRALKVIAETPVDKGVSPVESTFS